MIIIAKYGTLKSFYASIEWQKFRKTIIAERGLVCEHCKEIVYKASDITLHHKVALTPENVHDISISLNPSNVELIHRSCHDRIHNRFGYKPGRNVYIVFGAPLSGKKSYIQEYMNRGDLIVDMDSLYAAVSMLPDYDKPDNLLNNVRGIHNMLLDNIKTRYGKWNNAWIIGGYANKHKREKLAEDLGAEIIFCDVSKAECISRLEADEERRYRKDEWKGYIERWFEEYSS